MADVYRDSLERYARDAEFRAMADMMFHAGRANAWTPGEMRQIAFLAALKLEQYAARLEQATSQMRGCPEEDGREE